MRPHPDHHAPEDLPQLLRACGRHLARHSDPKRFLDWIASTGPDLAPSLAASVGRERAAQQRLFRSLGVHIYNATPLPDHNFQPRPLPLPGPSQACLCGSGYRFRDCCQELLSDDLLAQFNMLPVVLEALPLRCFHQLPESGVDPLAVADTASQWLEANRGERSVALLEPWFSQPGMSRERQSQALPPLFDALMDSYLLLNRPRKRERLIRQMLEAGIRSLRCCALQRRAAIRADEGDAEGAWQDFLLAQQENPDDPALAVLELTLLMARGENRQARERARFWLARLNRDKDAPAGMLDMLQLAAQDPELIFSGMATQGHPSLPTLEALLNQAPPMESLYVFPTRGRNSRLQPGEQLQALEEAWRQVFLPAQLNPYEAEQAEVAWQQAPAWLAWLAQHPQAWQSLRILNHLSIALDALESAATEPLQWQVLERGQALVAQVLQQASEAGVSPRHAMATLYDGTWLLGQLAYRYQEVQQHEHFIPLAEALLELLPGDNPAIVSDLARAYLACNQAEKTLALTESHPTQHTDILLNRILAHYRLGQKVLARRLLLRNGIQLQQAVDLLLSRAEPPHPQGMSEELEAGSLQEAWLYRMGHLPLWEQDDALSWLEGARNDTPIGP